MSSDLLELARGLRYDLTAMQAKVTDLLNAIGELNLPDTTRSVCGQCGASFRGRLSLDEHLYVSHDGPEPPHWLKAEAKAEVAAG